MGRQGEEGWLLLYVERSEIGCSIGTTGSAGSFSAGVYAELENDPSKVYCVSYTTVSRKALPRFLLGITLPPSLYSNHLPPILKITDLDFEAPGLRFEVQEFTSGAHAQRPAAAASRKRAEAELALLDTKNFSFGTVKWGKQTEVDWEAAKTNSDWCLIEMSEKRYSDNYVDLKPPVTGQNNFRTHRWDPILRRLRRPSPSRCTGR